MLIFGCLALGGCKAPERDQPARSSLPPAAVAPPSATAAPTGASPLVAPAPASRHYVVAAVGDSLTDPRSHGGGYLEYLRSRCPGIEIDNFGKGATMVNQMRRSYDAQVVASGKHYTHLIVFGGVNDLYSDLTALRTPAKIEADLAYMYGHAKANGVRVVALTVAPWGGFKRYFNDSRAAATRELNAWIREQSTLGRVDATVDAYALLSCGDADTLCDRFFMPFKDGIHFGPDGHLVLGQALFQAAFSDCE